MYKNITSIALIIGLYILSPFFIHGEELELNKKNKKPNIILILTDDQGYGDLSIHGSPDVQTPNMDKLKTQSASLEDFHVSPTCGPTRSAIMSGRVPFKNGITHTILERERLTLGVTLLPEILKKAQYTTGVFGKWHLGDEKPYQPESRGFDEVFIHGAGGIGQSFPGTCADVPRNRYNNPILKHNDHFVQTEGFCTDVLFLQALSWIKESASKDKPFFAYIATNAPHGPFLAPESYKKKFADKGYPPSGQGFYGMIENIDDNLGTLMKKLDDWNLTDNTILIFMTDNGRTPGPTDPNGKIYNAGMKGLKSSPHQGGTRVPFFIKWKNKIKAGTKINSLFSHYDIFPSMAEVAGVDISDIPLLDGESFMPFVTGKKTTPTEKYRFIHVSRWPGNPKNYEGLPERRHFFKGNEENSNPKNAKYRNCAVRSQQYRFTNNKALYDLYKDPQEKVNVINEHPEIVEKMRKAYDKWWKSMLPMMINENVNLNKEQPFVVEYKKQLKEEGIPKWVKPILD